MSRTLPALQKTTLTISMAAALTAIPVTGAMAQSSRNDLGFADSTICIPDTIDVPESLKSAPGGDQSELPTSIEADEIEAITDSVIRLTGNAEVVQGRRGVYADEITYDQETYTARAEGNVVFYTERGDEIRTDLLEIEADTFIGTAGSSHVVVADPDPYVTKREHEQFIEDYSILAPFTNRVVVPEETEDKPVDPNVYARARGTADSIDMEGKGFQRLHRSTLTTCTEGNEDILLTAKEIELDHVSGTGRAENMTVRFKKVPIFYFPKVTFPINNERKTGFLFPGIGYNDDSGMIVEVPYYINIAPAHDATIIPRYHQYRGVQVYAEYRYLTERSRGIIKGEGLPSDDLFDDEDRYALSYAHDHRFNRDWSAEVDLQTVSDTSYARDFANDVDVASSSYIPQRGSVRYRGDLIDFQARLAAYERINDTVSVSDQPYERLPDVTLDLKQQKWNGFNYGIDSEYINYQHEDNTLVDGSRLRFKPYVTYPLEEVYGYVEPRFSVQTINYDLENNPTGDDSPSVAVPITSVDSGLFFERIFKRNENVFLQTLEPRLFYLYIPEESEQNLFPDFDTGGGSNSSFSHFFRENRFFGGDRVGDTHQITLGLTSKTIDDESGEERFSLSLGQIYYFEDREIQLSPEDPPDTEDKSDFLAEFSGKISEDWRFTGFSRWESEGSDLAFFRLSADYDHSRRRNASVGYSYTKDGDEQVNVRFEAPLGPRWQLGARADYSIEDSESRAHEVELTYDGCCWATRLGVQRFLDGTGEFSNRYILTFELDDLGRLSSRL